MEVMIISDTIQAFNGERFYLCGNYFQHCGRRLHVAVWRHHNGEIPEGCHIHHKDKNRGNNDIKNLELMKGPTHLSMHASAPEREEYNRRHIEDMRKLAGEWHGSEEGKAWHGEHAKKFWAGKKEREYTCVQCGKTFNSKHDYGENVNVFCPNACKTTHRLALGLDNETRTCAYCGREFTVNKYAKTVCCSRDCSVRKRWGK